MLARASFRNLLLTAVMGGAGCLAVLATKSSAAPILYEVPNTYGTTAIAAANNDSAHGPGLLIARNNHISLISARD